MSSKPKAAKTTVQAAAKPVSAKRSASKTAAPKSDAVSLEPIIAAMRKRLPKARHAEAEAFAQAFYR
ncbi:MAG TPA: hypothetical protein VN158_16905, partial [Caulobacter sp.]|nr:hypothetical protein [Caulobacter sp.]